MIDLWPHQEQGAAALQQRRRFALWFDMGAGKTLTSLAALAQMGSPRALVLAPKGACPVWASEATKWYPGRWRVTDLSDGATVAARAKLLPDSGLLVVNYDVIWRPEMFAAVAKWRPEVIVADESHRIKSPRGKASLALSKLSKQADYRWCLSGTPLPHSPLDIFAQFRFMNMDIFGWSFVRFRNRYAVLGGFKNKQVVGFRNLGELHRIIGMHSMTVRSDDVIELPEVSEVAVPVRLGAKATRVYAQMDRELVADIATGVVTAANALVRLLRLQQLTGGWLQADDRHEPEQVDNSKLQACMDLIEGTQEPIVIFCQFHAEMDGLILACRKAGIPVHEISGRRRELEEWRRGGRVLVVQIRSGGEGIDLTRARYCVFYSTGFNLGAVLQARKRVHRPGQTRKVVYYHLVCQNTIDEDVNTALAKRQDLVKTVIEGRARR